jgi:penicillin-binding protein 1A
MAYCLAHSKNAAAYRLMQIIGPAKLVEFAHNCGVSVKIPAVPSIALGAAEVPMLQMLKAYTMFPDKGYNTDPLFISRIEDKDGNLLQEFRTETKQLISENDAFTMVKLMQGVVEFGTGRSLQSYGINVQKAGKTGTTNDNTDGWFIGYTPELLAGTWVGCDDPFIRIYAGVTGGNEMALPKWGYFMKKVYDDRRLGYGKVTEFQKPAEMDKDPIPADVNPAELFGKGDNIPDDVGNSQAEDYITDPSSDNTPPVPLLPSDTGKGPASGKKTTSPANIDDGKKKVKPTAGSNEY